MLSLFGFGKRRRTTRKASKPPAKLLKLCKKYRVKTTSMRGSKRSYRPTAMLKKLCLRKARALKKKLMKGTSTRRTRMGNEMEFGKRLPQMEFGSSCNMGNEMEFGKRLPQMEFGAHEMEFGKRRRQVNKVAAMKAFKSFYRRHCGPSGSRFGFGSGGNPPLWQSMGYEFCSDGGGVLGANSTGLFPTPCMPPPSAARPVAAAKPKLAAARKLSAALKKASPKTKAAVRKLIKKAAPKMVRKAASKMFRSRSPARKAASKMFRKSRSPARKAAPKMFRKSRSPARKAASKMFRKSRSPARKAGKVAGKAARKTGTAVKRDVRSPEKAAAARRRRATAFGFW